MPTSIGGLMRAPFVWFGGKSVIAPEVWRRFGPDVCNYVEPFFGSGAVLLNRPYLPEHAIETCNDADGFVSNAFRAITGDPAAVAHYADRMVVENDLHAIHAWLVERKAGLVSRLEGDPEYYDAKIAGWWLWGMSAWIGGEFCSGKGPWQSVEVDGARKLIRVRDGGVGVSRKLVHLGNTGLGVNRRRIHLGHAGQGVNQKRVHLGNTSHAGQGEHELCASCGEGLCGLYQWMLALSGRMRRVWVCCGDWARVCGPTPTFKHGVTAVFMDPPYSHEAGRDTVYSEDSGDVAHAVRQWCMENGDNPLLRIALCGYTGEGHEVLEQHGWSVLAWSALGGYGNQGNGRGRVNRKREQIWFSPACLKSKKTEQLKFF